ncbi:MAG: DUF1189 domain-containing protein [Verrucomicrobiae bacterium]|nr:DUF1189 domain-containing protein [Verrucomicrobiae bacterium]
MNFLRTVISLCAGFQSYRAIRDVPPWRAVGYLMVLMAVLGLVLMGSFVPWALGYAEEVVAWVEGNVPRFRLEGGRVVADDLPQPYYAGNEQMMFILDTTGTVTNADMRAQQGILFMADRYLMWVRFTNPPTTTIQTRQATLQGFPDGVVDGAYVRRLVRTFLWVAMPVVYGVVVLVGTLSALLQAYLFAGVATFTERSLPSPLTLNQLLSIAIHAVTPAAIVFTVWTSFRLSGVNLWLVYLVVYGVFLIGGTYACRNPVDGEDDGE